MAITGQELREQFSLALIAYAAEGIDVYRARQATLAVPVLSHVCFKFQNMNSYQAHVRAGAELGDITRKSFGGKEITWCRTGSLWASGGLCLEWLEMVEPVEAQAQDGIVSIAYHVPRLNPAHREVSADGRIAFRYFEKHARELALK